MVEIILVLLLIGILVTIGLMNYQKQIKTAHDARKKILIKDIEQAILAEATGTINFEQYDSDEKIYALLSKNGMELPQSPKEYYYFPTQNGFAVATCLSTNEKFYKGSFEPVLDCSNLSAQSISTGINF